MNAENRPYVDPGTEPGDPGTEEFAGTPAETGRPAARGPLADPGGTTDDGVVEGSPADGFINDADAVAARTDEGEQR